jgi:hypothetical protein
VSIRPSVGQEAASTEDDLTVLMSEIVEVNTKMRAIVADGVATNSLMVNAIPHPIHCYLCFFFFKKSVSFLILGPLGIPSTSNCNVCIK